MPKQIQTCEQVAKYCEPTGLQIDLDLLKTTLADIYAKVGYNEERWVDNEGNDSTISLSHPKQTPEVYVKKYGEFAGKFRIAGSEDALLKMGIYSSAMTELDPIVENSYIKTVRDQIIAYHQQCYPDQQNVRCRIHNATLGNGAGFKLHRDLHTTVRYHIATRTNDFCYMGVLDEDTVKLVHIPADGRVWSLDTQVFHNAMNIAPMHGFKLSELTRTHLIFTVHSEPAEL